MHPSKGRWRRWRRKDCLRSQSSTDSQGDKVEFPKRKSMRLRDFDYSQNGAYFITICTKDRARLFGEVVGDAHPGVPVVRLNAAGNIVKTHIENINFIYDDVALHKYVVMPNHIHIILSVINESDISVLQDCVVPRDAQCASPTKSVVAKVINAFKSLTSKQFGQSIWQRSYHDHIIRNENEYLRIWQYIDENTTKWVDDMYYCDTV